MISMMVAGQNGQSLTKTCMLDILFVSICLKVSRSIFAEQIETLRYLSALESGITKLPTRRNLAGDHLHKKVQIVKNG